MVALPRAGQAHALGRLARRRLSVDGSIAESKVADFAGEAAAADAAVMRDIAQPKRTALIACLIRVAQTRARDELAEMFCKRMAAITKRARAEL
jgi:hypothetical protein